MIELELHSLICKYTWFEKRSKSMTYKNFQCKLVQTIKQELIIFSLLICFLFFFYVLKVLWKSPNNFMIWQAFQIIYKETWRNTWNSYRYNFRLTLKILLIILIDVIIRFQTNSESQRNYRVKT